MEFYSESASIIHQAAFKIAGRGKPVFPCNTEKRPLVKWKDQATDDPERVRRLWAKHPGECIGLVTGSASGVLVIDVDHLPAIEDLPGPLPRTLTARTPSGGLHFYYRHVYGARNSISDIAENVDVRGEGGYVIAPPSPGYTWVDKSPVADAPEWLLDLIREKPANHSDRMSNPLSCRRPSNRDPSDAVDGDTIPNGARNDTLARIAGRLHDGRDLADLERALLEVNVHRCSPALPEGEVLKIARSIYQRDPCTPGG